MKKPIIIGIGLLVIVLLIVANTFKGDQTSEVEVATDSDGNYVVAIGDGLATLTIPPSALPAGLTPEDISIAPLSAADVFDNPDVSGLAYELLPEGTEFSEPVILSLTGELSGDALPMVLHKNDTVAELGAPDMLLIDPLQNTYTLAVGITHFSKVGVDKSRGLFHYRFEGGGTAKVGESLPFKLEIWPDAEHTYFYDYKGGYNWTTETYSGRGFHYKFAPGGWYDIDGWSIKTSSVLSPQESNVPGQINLKADDVYRYETTLTCMEPGFESPMVNDLDLIYRSARSVSRERESSGWQYQNDSTYFFIYTEYECTDKDGNSGDILLGDDFETVPPEPEIVIEYGGKYLPVELLEVAPEEECGGEHYHAPGGSVTATDGSEVPDPGPKCGFGKTSDFEPFDIGLELEETAIEYRDGVESTHVRKLNGLNKYGNITLKWGITDSLNLPFWNWILENSLGVEHEAGVEEGGTYQLVDPPTLSVPAAPSNGKVKVEGLEGLKTE